MILDYKYNDKFRKFEISYIGENGQKQLLNFNVDKFKTYYYTPTGKYETWNGARCDEKWTEKPSKFDIKYFIYGLSDQYQKLISQKTFPKVYTFDIETEISDEFPEPSEAKQPITAISVVSPSFETVVLGVRPLSDEQKEGLKNNFEGYLNNTKFFKELNMPIPHVKYIKFDTEGDMLKFFLNNIVAKVPIISGWNCIFFDWQYIVNRIKNYYPNISIASSSCVKKVVNKRFQNERGMEVQLPIPVHTHIIDMMEIVKGDHMIIPFKQSYALDYIAHESLGVNKITYDGTLQDLYNNDFGRYVYYNAIDSILVQLINYKFKLLDQIYLMSLFCKEKIDKCFSKIALTESLVFKDFYERGLKIVTEDIDNVRGTLLGAYVKKPIPGVHEWVSCNDFASLYPSTIRTCNLSFENFLGNSSKFTKEEIEKFKNDPNYFVSVNNNVYKNDKDYAFRRIQTELKARRDHDKYLSKKLEAIVMTDIDHILNGKKVNNIEYPEDIVGELTSIGYEIKNTEDLIKLEDSKKVEFKRILHDTIMYLTTSEQSIKTIMNSMYGGSSHISFYWYNMDLANDITGESRNLIHKMEYHIQDYFKHDFINNTELHKILGIEIDKEQAKIEIEKCPYLTKEQDPEGVYHEQSLVYQCYGDTDSAYFSYGPLIRSIVGYDKMTIEEKRDLIVNINTKFLNMHNRQYIKEYYDTRFGKSVHDFELETIALSGVWLDVKKRYAQILAWKDGKKYDIDNLPMKIKGLEIVQSSFPELSRDIMKNIVRFLLENAGDRYLIQKLNLELQKYKVEFNNADIEKICSSVKINNYDKYIGDDKGSILKVNSKCPFNVRALGNYNHIRNKYHLEGEPIYGGKLKYYLFTLPGTKNIDYFAFQSMNLPTWAYKYAPINKGEMFKKTVIEPLNRLFESNNLPHLNTDGSIQVTLF